MKKITANSAAADIRGKILRKMNQLDQDVAYCQEKWDLLRIYIKGMANRASGKSGGLGRK